jgi:hypothetical protein
LQEDLKDSIDCEMIILSKKGKLRLQLPSVIKALGGFDLDVDTGSDGEDFEFVDGVGCGVEDVEHPDVRADLKLLARFAVYVRRAKDGVNLSFCGERDRSCDPSAGALGSFDDIGYRAVENALVIALQSNSNLLLSWLFSHNFKFS